jgi:hypothetical protein
MSAVPSLTSEIPQLNSNRKFQDIVRKPVVMTAKTFPSSVVMTAKTFPSSYERGFVIKKFVIALLRFYMIAIFAGASRGSCIFFNVIIEGLREIS